MFCHNCGTELEEGSAFCPECGARQSDGPDASELSGSTQNEPVFEAAFESEEPAPENGSRSFLLIVILIIVLGAALGAGGFFLYQRMSSPSTPKAQNTADKDDAEKASSKEEKGKASDKEKEEKAKDADTKDETKDSEQEAPKEVTYVHEYTIVQGMWTWSDAKTYCEAQGGHLATVISQDEYDQMLAKANETGCVVLWIGGQRIQDGSFGWVTGEDFSFNAWASGEPNNDGGAENCLGLMKVNGAWSMYDMPNDVSQYYSASKVGFIMEKDIAQ